MAHNEQKLPIHYCGLECVILSEDITNFIYLVVKWGVCKKF
jgi:hypothetical protein